MRNADLRSVALFTGWLVTLFLGGVLAGELVFGAAVTTPLFFVTSVNLSVSNSSLTVTASSGVNTYALSNITTSYLVPVLFSENISLFNVTADLNESERCFARINETVSNQTAYLEGLIRGQLVPSQKQYADLVSQKAEFERRCEDEKNILRNEAVDWRVKLNATRANYESVVQRQGAELEKVRGEKKTYYFLFIVFGLASALMLVGFAKNFTFKTVWDSFANMRGSRPSVGYAPPPPQQEVRK